MAPVPGRDRPRFWGRLVANSQVRGGPGGGDRPSAVRGRMVAPALVAVNVPAGRDQVEFRFHGYGDYPALLALSGLTLALIAVVPACARRRRFPASPRPGPAIGL